MGTGYKKFDSRWVVDTRFVWDLKYTQGRLTIKNEPRDILPQIELRDGELFLEGKLYWKNITILMDDYGIHIPETKNTISNLTLDGNNVAGGISIAPRKN